MGGLARRVSYANALSTFVKGQAPIVQVDLGNMFSDDRTPAGMSAETRIRNEWMLRAFEKFPLDAANVSHRDLPYLGPLMKKTDYAKNLKQYPALAHFISANVVPKDGTCETFKPYVIQEVKGQRLGAHPLKVGILGLSERAPGPVTAATAGYQITDPVVAAQKYVPELRAKCDLVVVLVYMDRESAKKIGTATKGVDLIFAARQLPLYNTVDEAGDAVVAMVANQTKWLGEIRLYTAEAAATTGENTKPAKLEITNYIHRDVPLDDGIPDDPEALKVVGEARKGFLDAQGKTASGGQ